jgi:nitrogen fixation NifU-like protein
MSDLHDLYQEIIIDHSKCPRNFRRLESANHQADGYNPLCGDRLTLYVKTEDGKVADCCFEGSGCAIHTASTSMLTESLKGKTLEEAKRLYARFINLVAGSSSAEADPAELGKLAALAGVKEFPVRVKCATLAWHTLLAALEDKQKQEPVSSEGGEAAEKSEPAAAEREGKHP